MQLHECDISHKKPMSRQFHWSYLKQAVLLSLTPSHYSLVSSPMHSFSFYLA